MREKYLAGTAEILRQSQKEQEPYETLVCGRKFLIRSGVFSPKYFRDTEIFAENLPIQPGVHLLEIGPGCGAISVIAALSGAARVVAIDINSRAASLTAENAERHGVSHLVEARQGDLFDALKPGESFHRIFWNTPFGLVKNNTQLSDLERAVFDPGYKNTRRFIAEGPRHLTSGGCLNIGFSSTLGNLGLLERFCGETGLRLELVCRKQSEEVYPVQFELFEARI